MTRRHLDLEVGGLKVVRCLLLGRPEILTRRRLFTITLRRK